MKSVFLAKTSPTIFSKFHHPNLENESKHLPLTNFYFSSCSHSKLYRFEDLKAQKIFEGQKSRGAARSRWGDELIDSLARRGLYVNSFVNRNEFEYWFPAGRLDRGLGRGEASANAICSWRRFAASVICTTMLRQLREARPSFNLLWLEFRRRSIVGRMDGWMDRRGEREVVERMGGREGSLFVEERRGPFVPSCNPFAPTQFTNKQSAARICFSFLSRE